MESADVVMEHMEGELELLRAQISMLTKQYYKDRQQWLEEKRCLLESRAAQQPPVSHAERTVSSSFTACSESASDAHECPGNPCVRERTCSSFTTTSGQSLSRSGSPMSSTGEGAARGNPTVVISMEGPCPSSASCADGSEAGDSGSDDGAAAAAAGAIAAAAALERQVTTLQQQLEEGKRQSESAAARWAMEREALQRQVHALISLAEPGTPRGGSDGGAQPPLSHRQPQGGLSRLGGQRYLHHHTAGGALPTHGSFKSDGGGSGGGAVHGCCSEAAAEAAAQEERVAELEALVEELQAERTNLEEQLRVAAAEAARAGRAFAARAASASAGGAAGGGVCWERNLTLTDSVSLPALLAEKAELERALRALREECVAVPRPEYAELSSARQQLAFLEAEAAQLRDEAEAAGAAREAAEAELAAVLAGCVSVPREEYEALLRGAAEARARDAVSALGAASPAAASAPGVAAASAQGAVAGSVAVPLDEHRRLLACLHERDALTERVTALQRQLDWAVAEAAEAPEAAEAQTSEVLVLREQLAAAVGASVSECARLSGRVRELEEELEALRRENASLASECGACRNALAAGARAAAAQANGETRAAAAAVAAAGERAAAVEELRSARQRIKVLEAELAAARQAASAAKAERDVLLQEVGAVRDAAVRTTLALAECEARREAVEGAAAAAAAEAAAVSGELAAVRRELCGARDLGALLKRDKLRSRRLAGLPQEWMAGWGSGGSSGEHTAALDEAGAEVGPEAGAGSRRQSGESVRTDAAGASGAQA